MTRTPVAEMPVRVERLQPPDRPDKKRKYQKNHEKEGKNKARHHEKLKNGGGEMRRAGIAVYPETKNRQGNRCQEDNQQCRFVSHDFIFLEERFRSVQRCRSRTINPAGTTSFSSSPLFPAFLSP